MVRLNLNKMRYLKNFIILNAILMSVLAIFLLLENSKEREISDTSAINISIYKVDNGFGYSISSKNKILIRQNFIPVFETKQPFSTFNDAQSIANLVKKRIENKQSPRITKEDLSLLEIRLNCVDLQ